MNINTMYKLDFGDRMTDKQVKDAVDFFISYQLPLAIKLDRYKMGKNNKRERIRTVGEDVGECIVIPYGRKIIKTVAGYMFKPGNIGYESDNDAYKDAIDEIRDENEDDIKTSRLGDIVSTFGIGYEIFELKEESIKYYPMKPTEVMPIFSFDIEPVVKAFIRIYQTDKNYTTKESTFTVDVYYDTTMQSYEYKKDTLKKMLYLDNENEVDELEHGFERPPLVVYYNNAEILGDFEPVLPLIDAYDVLMSDGFTEVEKFAMAYLVLSDVSIAEDDIDKIKKRRILEMTEQGKAEYLTKNLSPEYIKFIKEWIREEIHKQAQIPDMSDNSFAGDQSGIAIRYKLSDLENLCADKEIYFRKGLYDRLDFISWYLTTFKKVQGEIDEVEVTFTRNFPQNYSEIGDIIMKLRGAVSLETLLSKLVPFVEDATEEMKKIDQENAFEPLEE